MNVRLTALAVTASVLTLPFLAMADEITVSSNTGSSNVFDASGNTTIAVQQFDGSLGTLTGAALTFEGIAQPQFQVLNLGSSAATATGSTTVSYTLTGNGLVDVTGSAATGTQTVSVAAGFGNTASSVPGFSFISQAGVFASLAALTGTGVLDFSLDELFTTSGRFTAGVGGVGGTGTSDLGVMITYDFTPTAVPEPATFAILGAGLLGIGLVRRRRA